MKTAFVTVLNKLNFICRIPSRFHYLCIFICIIVADFLFWDQTVGISLAIFLGGLAIVAWIGNPVRCRPDNGILAVTVLALGLLPLIETVNMLSILFGCFGTALFAQSLVLRQTPPWITRLRQAAALLVSGPARLRRDCAHLYRSVGRQNWDVPVRRFLINWCMPICGLAVFLALFSSANPLIENGLNHIDFSLGGVLALASPSRILFWGCVLAAVRPLIPTLPPRRRPIRPVLKPTTIHPHGSFGDAALLRSLILFNAVFALQTGLDLTYLWGEVTLPDGMTYAAYAHRGAYPLVITALLAAAFVLATLRPNGPAERSRLIRLLVLAWIGQNILLVISSIRRVDLYIVSYSLSELRFYALIWMMLVAIGLALIIIKIVLNKPTHWLIIANVGSIILTFYILCFVDSQKVIATYNVAHCSEIGKNTPHLDEEYLVSLGPSAIPAIDNALNYFPPDTVQDLVVDRARLVTKLHWNSDNWRAWTFRAWRLKRYIKLHQTTNGRVPGDGLSHSRG